MNNKEQDILENEFNEFEENVNNKELLGQFLKEKRIQNKVSVDDLAKEFIIRASELEEFEEGKENPSFSRLLAIKYAKKFDANNDEFKALLDASYPNTADDYTQVISGSEKITFNSSITKKNNKRVVKRVIVYIISLIFLLILIASLVVLLTKNFQSVSNDVQNETTLVSQVTLTPASVVGETPKTKVEFVEQKTINNGELNTLVYDVTEMEDKEIYEVTFSAVEDIYITVYDENWTIMQQQVLIEKGETLTFDASGISQVNVTVDNIKNLKISVNGADIQLEDQEQEGYYLIQINNMA